MNTMFTLDVSSEREALECIYDFLKQPFLTNPEYSLIDGSGTLAGSKTFGNNHTALLGSFDDFKRELNRIRWDVCLCVAGTDAADTRRMVISYYRDTNKLIINYVAAGSGMTAAEKRIHNWLNNAIT